MNSLRTSMTDSKARFHSATDRRRAHAGHLNPELAVRIPLRLMRENDLETVAPEVMGAARSFLVDG